MIAQRTLKSPGFAYALIAAFLFGASTPASKILLAKTDPLFLAGMLYFGSGVGLLILILIRSQFKKYSVSESRLTRKDIPWLAGATFFGGILAPVLLMNGLVRTEAASASLFLNMEGVFTALLAWFVFREHFDRRIFIGMVLIILGGLILSWTSHPTIQNISGPLFIIAACFSWGIDNNVTRKVSAHDPLQITVIKSLIAGSTNLVLAMVFHVRFPDFSVFLTASFLGFVSYGLSLSCFILALRHIGTSRTGALFSLAPFIGTGLSLFILHESISLQIAAAGILMGLGVWLHLTEKHSHEHTHEALEHEHRHTHDEHHQHEHEHHLEDPSREPHTHWHRHEPLTHNHPHYPDIHHRHAH